MYVGVVEQIVIVNSCVDKPRPTIIIMIATHIGIIYLFYYTRHNCVL